jgi:hypothetical protein
MIYSRFRFDGNSCVPSSFLQCYTSRVKFWYGFFGWFGYRLTIVLILPWFIAKGILTNKIGMGKQMDKMAKKRTQHIKLGMVKKERHTQGNRWRHVECAKQQW